MPAVVIARRHGTQARIKCAPRYLHFNPIAFAAENRSLNGKHEICPLHLCPACGVGRSMHGKVCFEDDLPFVGRRKEGAKSSQPGSQWSSVIIRIGAGSAGTTPNADRKRDRLYAARLMEQKVMNSPCRESRLTHHHPHPMLPATNEVASTISPTSSRQSRSLSIESQVVRAARDDEEEQRGVHATWISPSRTGPLSCNAAP